MRTLLMSSGGLIAAPPPWLEVVDDPVPDWDDLILADLDGGERAAVQLARSMQARLLIMDDRAGVVAATQKGLVTTGTLGVLKLAATRNLVNMEVALNRLMATNFRYPRALIDQLMESVRIKGSQASAPVECDD